MHGKDLLLGVQTVFKQGTVILVLSVSTNRKTLPDSWESISGRVPWYEMPAGIFVNRQRGALKDSGHRYPAAGQQ